MNNDAKDEGRHRKSKRDELRRQDCPRRQRLLDESKDLEDHEGGGNHSEREVGALPPVLKVSRLISQSALGPGSLEGGTSLHYNEEGESFLMLLSVFPTSKCRL